MRALALSRFSYDFDKIFELNRNY